MIFDEEFVDPLWAALNGCRGVSQHPVYHPEGCVWIHSVQTFRWACRESFDTDLMLAALLHDVGKQVESPGHEKHGLVMLKDHTTIKTQWLIQHHMRIWDLLNGQMKKRGKINELVGHPWLPELILLARWDHMAREPGDPDKWYDWLTKGDLMARLNTAAKQHFRTKPAMECTICQTIGGGGCSACTPEKEKT